jgi:hypothetical protein
VTDPALFEEIDDAMAWNRTSGNGSYEYRADVLSKYKGSDRFIAKFNLTPYEIELAGSWFQFGFKRASGDDRGIGIEISFLPNRVFIARSQIEHKDKKGYVLSFYQFYKLGFWKIEGGKLKIKFIHRYIEDGLRPPPDVFIDNQRWETKYYSIWEPVFHDTAAFQLTPFYYDKIPQKIKEFYHVVGNEDVRYRKISPLSFNSEDAYKLTLYEETKPWHQFLMNPDLDDEEYVYTLLVMYIWGNYDFKENLFGLDFSKWQ